ncbi:transposase, partial [Alicyclobacillus tolerans]|uniref:transposase n=1 Tax=Alicyclobacillus tolerans TaxID=90970 RepID=UPI0027D91372
MDEEIPQVPTSENQVAIDLGLTDSVAQRRLAKKKKGSKNRDKERLKVARIHAKIADRRQDFLHKL